MDVQAYKTREVASVKIQIWFDMQRLWRMNSLMINMQLLSQTRLHNWTNKYIQSVGMHNLKDKLL